jgi:predicted ATPase
LLDPSASLADTLLRAAPDITIIATSRDPLDVAGEQIYALPTLSLPEAADNMERIGRSEAVQLFVARAQRQHYGFSLTAANASIVAQICTRLDGIPLALELAAARVRSLSVEQINARLDDRFGLLTGGTRTHAAPANAARRTRLELRSSRRAEAHRLAPSGHLRRRVHARRRGVCRGRRRNRPTRGDRCRRPAGYALAGRRRHR